MLMLLDVKKELFGILNKCTSNEIQIIKDKLNNGKMNFSTFWSEDTKCGCLLGTIGYERTDDKGNFNQEIGSEIAKTITNKRWGTLFEVYFFWIQIGHTPENDVKAKELMDLLNEYTSLKQLTFERQIKGESNGKEIELQKTEANEAGTFSRA